MSIITQLTQKWVSRGLKLHQRRGVSPIIATLLLVAIAVVGGSIIFVFSQGFFATAQISGSPQIESIKILGYDATDGPVVAFHDGVLTTETVAVGGALTSDELNTGEYVAVYVKNDSVNKVTFSEIRLAGAVYLYEEMSDATPTVLPNYQTTCVTPSDGTNALLDCEEYTLVVKGVDLLIVDGIVSDTSAPELQPGQEATIVMALDKDVKVARDMQFKLTTTNGAVFIATIQSGQQSG
jgi:flagellin-like protein